MMWRDFPGLFEHVDEADVLANLKPAFETTSTRSAIRNALYVLVAEPEFRRTVREPDPKELGRFLEEVFRLYGGIELPRIALRDVELGGVLIRAGEAVIPIAGSANVDPARFTCPHDIDTTRTGLRDHLFFNRALGRAPARTSPGPRSRRPCWRCSSDYPGFASIPAPTAQVRDDGVRGALAAA